MVKAIFFDIDGTLVSFKTHEVPRSTIDALDILRKKGIKVFIATGRHYSSINNLGDLKFDGYVTLNGGYCFAGEDKVIYKHGIPDRDIDALIRYLETEESFPCAFVQEKEIFMNYKDETVEEIFNMLNFPEPPIRPLSEMKGKTVYQLVSFFTAEQEKKIMSILSHCESTRWNPLFTDVVPVGGNKSIGMEKILAYFGISREETMAFGDGGNDIPMLEYAGIGVAMGNASEEVQRHADFVTSGVDDEGIVHALKHFHIGGL